MNLSPNLIRCPICHSKLIGVRKEFNKETWETLKIMGYCPSVKCKVKRAIFNKNLSLLSVEYYKSLKVKRKVIANILKQNYKKYSPKTKKRLKAKYEKLVLGKKS